MMEDFIVDDELYFQQVEDSPWIIFGGDLEEFFQNNPNFQVPKDRYGLVSGDGGGTDITLALKAITEQFDQDERKLKISGTDVSKMRRSLLIITDAEVYSFPADELGGLSKRNIKPYVILVRASNEVSTPEFANRIKDYGGEYFDVSDATSLKRAYEAIDRLEAVEIEITRRIFTFPIFQKFILASVLIIFCAIFIGLILAPFEAYP
jgi:hypothetical protein